MSEFKNNHLNEVLETHRMSKIQDKMDKYLIKRDKIKDSLESQYNGKIVRRAINSGSYAKFTAVNNRFDIDICQPFRKDSFGTLQEMADDLYEYFDVEYRKTDGDLEKVKKQRVSVGLTFLIDNEEVPMDVVPGRELVEGGYNETKNLNLHVRAKGDTLPTSTQTNISKHVDLIKGKLDERSIIRLMKIWKIKHNPEIKSFFLELITIKAFEKNAGNIPNGKWNKLKMVMEYIRDNVKTVTLKDPANSNNIVSNTLNYTEKEQFSEDMENALNQIDRNEQRINYYFPKNEDFCEKESTPSRAASVIPTAHFS
jgi:hypothetical protein